MNLSYSTTSMITCCPIQPQKHILYSQRFVLYTKNYLHQIESILLFISDGSPHCKTYPIFKMLKAMSRMLLLTEIELIFVANVVKLTEWNFNHYIINKTQYVVFPFIFYDTSIKEDQNLDLDMKEKIRHENLDRQMEFKRLSLYILLVGYCAKFFAVDPKEQIKEYLNEVTRYCIDFDITFRKWVSTEKQLSKLLNPKILNELSIKINEMSQKDELNPNLIIDLIVQLSPAYNAKKKIENERTA